MTKNRRRNPNRPLKFNFTGDMSCFALKGIPFCIEHSAWLIQDYELSKIRHYIENVVHPGEVVVDLQVCIEWRYQSDDDKENEYIQDFFPDDSSEINAQDGISDDDAKQSILGDSDSDNDGNIDSSNVNLFSKVNNVNLGDKNNISNESDKITGIKLLYSYKLENDDNEYIFDNSDNKAEVVYSRTFYLSSMFDYITSFRELFGVLCTVQWPKTIYKETPSDIKNSQLVGRSALYKGFLFIDFMLHDYAYVVGGPGMYQLEAFWHYNPEGYGLAAVCQQMCENFGGWIKEDRKECGSGNGDNYLHEIARNCDLNVLARLYYDQACLREISRERKLKHISTFDKDVNFEVEQQLVRESPVLFGLCTEYLHSMKVNDIVPEWIKFFQDDTDKSVFDKVRKSVANRAREMKQDEMEFKYDNINNNSSSIGQKWRSRVQNYSQMVKNMQKSQMNRVLKSGLTKNKKQKAQRKSKR